MRKRAPNPFPGVSRAPDRHGKVRWRLRRKGLPSLYLPGEYGSVEFRQAYEAAISGKAALIVPSRHKFGTFDWLVEHYKRTPKWQKLRPISSYNLSNEIERFRREHGTKRVATLRAEHIEAMIAKKAESPTMANRLLKLLRRLLRFAIKKRLISVDPSIGVEPYAENRDGFHTWTDEEIARFEDYHGLGSKAVLAERLILCTGAAREDVIRLGWQSVRNDRIAYRRLKTGGDVDLPILDDLFAVLDPLPRDRLLFITHTGSRPYKPASFGNWFHDQCVAAGIPHCAPHGLRKAGATRLANAGGTEFEVMTFLGHSTPDEARTYVKKANRQKLGDSGMQKVERAKREQNLSNRIDRLDKHRRKALEGKGN